MIGRPNASNALSLPHYVDPGDLGAPILDSAMTLVGLTTGWCKLLQTFNVDLLDLAHATFSYFSLR
jgi:hypothetical protein